MNRPGRAISLHTKFTVLTACMVLTVIGGLGVMLGILRPVLRLGRTSGDEHMQAARRLSARVVERLETTLEVKSQTVAVGSRYTASTNPKA